MARDGHTTQAGGPEADLPRFVPQFVVDRNVGRLATWLRAMGYDTLFPADADDNQLVRIALRESRVIVTRDGGLARRRLATTGQISVVLVEHDDLRSQLRQVVYILGLGPSRRRPVLPVCALQRASGQAGEGVGARLGPTLRLSHPARVHGVFPLWPGVLEGDSLGQHAGGDGPNSRAAALREDG